MTCSRPQQTVPRPGLEPGTPWSVVRDANHCASPSHFEKFSVACFGVRVSGTFHLICVHIFFSSVSVAEWPAFGK